MCLIIYTYFTFTSYYITPESARSAPELKKHGDPVAVQKTFNIVSLRFIPVCRVIIHNQ